MTADQIAAATACVDAAHDGSLSFTAIVGKLIGAGYESYAVDYRRNSQTCYLPNGDSIMLDLRHSAGSVAADLDRDRVASLVQWAQANGPDYSYARFCEQAKAAGCAGYLVSFLGRRVVYYGRTAETHVELFP